MKGKSKSGKEIPKSLDYFNIEPFDELVNVYGKKPDKILVYAPANSIEDFYYSEYNTYGGGEKAIKKRQCDGEVCLHRVEESVNGQTYQAGEETDCICKDLPDGHKDRCKSYTGLKMFIADPKSGKIISPIPFYFETRSDNSSDNIYSELEKTWNFTGGRLIGIPFVLTVKMIDGLREGEKTKFPIWSMQAVGTVEKQLALAQVGMIPTTNELALPVNIEDESRMIEAPEEEQESIVVTIGQDQWIVLKDKADEVGMSDKGLLEIMKAYGYNKGSEILLKDYNKILDEVSTWLKVADDFQLEPTGEK